MAETSWGLIGSVLHVYIFALYSPYNVSMGEMKRANAYEEQRRMTDRFASTLVIAASVIAAVRLARDDISRPSPRLTSVVADSVGLARAILSKVVH
jgi:hypothetical protein